MKTENTNLSMFIMKSFELKKNNFILISMPPHVFFLYKHVVDLLICLCIYV